MISDRDLIAHTRALDEDIETLRRLEKAAIAYIQNRTGRYFGVEAEIEEVVRWRGWPLSLANEPIDGEITSLESWDGSAYTAMDSTSYYVFGSHIFGEGTTSWTPLTAPNRFRVTYQAGYAQLEDENEWDAPEDVKQAVLLLVGHWFENREAVVVDGKGDQMDLTIDALLGAHTRIAV